jgi:hypothetical protein
MDRAVITGTFADLKLIKTRSVIQVVIECPIEAWKKLTDVLGFPIPGTEIPVAIARLKNSVEPKAKRGSLAADAGILCNAPTFVKFLEENYKHIKTGNPWDAAAVVRSICGVDSRAEFDTDSAAGRRWRDLKAYYDGWKDL